MKKGNGHRIRSLLYLPQKQGIEKYFKLPTHYSLHDFCANCNRQTEKVCLLFGETIEHFFNNLLEICLSV
ncbi:hypothetical protein, partial [Gemmiger sp.]|uniref:hypothetical protein n=2 Tax=Gemmiger sp. TaxID=2049027 RepID=UPI00307F2301